jgi:hypothetical protein
MFDGQTACELNINLDFKGKIFSAYSEFEFSSIPVGAGCESDGHLYRGKWLFVRARQEKF